MKSGRLLSILLLLQTRNRVSAEELARRLEVSVRTIYRDVEALSATGVPVYAERGRHGGIALLPGYRTDVSGLTADEARALFVLTAQSAHSALGLDAALGSALRKVMAALPAAHRPAAELTSRRILIDADRWMSRPVGESVVDLDLLHTAVLGNSRLRIRYRHSGETQLRTYTVDPYGLVAKAGTWYLVADRRSRPQLFRADRIATATAVNAPVRRRPGVELSDAWAALRKQVEERPGELAVTALVARGRLDMFQRILGFFLDPLPEPDDDEEWVTVHLRLPALGAVRQLLQFGTDVEVIGPPGAREELARAAHAVTALYQQPAGVSRETSPRHARLEQGGAGTVVSPVGDDGDA